MARRIISTIIGWCYPFRGLVVNKYSGRHWPRLLYRLIYNLGKGIDSHTDPLRRQPTKITLLSLTRFNQALVIEGETIRSGKGRTRQSQQWRKVELLEPSHPSRLVEAVFRRGN
jgi:hypothetical protein